MPGRDARDEPAAPLRRVTVRFSEPSRAIVSGAARAEGITFAQYVREAALMRAAFQYGLDVGHTDVGAAIEAGLRMIRERWDSYGRPNGEG